MIRGLIHLPWRAMWEVLCVFVFGARKHKDDLWFEAGYSADHFTKKGDDHVEFFMYDNGLGKYDDETGRHELAHAVCDYLMAMALDMRERLGKRG